MRFHRNGAVTEIKHDATAPDDGSNEDARSKIFSLQSAMRQTPALTTEVCWRLADALQEFIKILRRRGNPHCVRSETSFPASATSLVHAEAHSDSNVERCDANVIFLADVDGVAVAVAATRMTYSVPSSESSFSRPGKTGNSRWEEVVTTVIS
jgi:hypothetical protein